jgi:choline dehydrogenase-like flavoprotein
VAGVAWLSRGTCSFSAPAAREAGATGSAPRPGARGSGASRRHGEGRARRPRTMTLGRVVDERCRVLGFENLYVVDASAIPEIPSANTNLTTIALAERAAEWL